MPKKPRLSREDLRQAELAAIRRELEVRIFSENLVLFFFFVILTLVPFLLWWFFFRDVPETTTPAPSSTTSAVPVVVPPKDATFLDVLLHFAGALFLGILVSFIVYVVHSIANSRWFQLIVLFTGLCTMILGYLSGNFVMFLAGAAVFFPALVSLIRTSLRSVSGFGIGLTSLGIGMAAMAFSYISQSTRDFAVGAALMVVGGIVITATAISKSTSTSPKETAERLHKKVDGRLLDPKTWVKEALRKELAEIPGIRGSIKRAYTRFMGISNLDKIVEEIKKLEQERTTRQLLVEQAGNNNRARGYGMVNSLFSIRRTSETPATELETGRTAAET